MSVTPYPKIELHVHLEGTVRAHTLLRRCPSCGAAFSSIAAVDCEECGKPIRPDELFGSPIKRRR